MNPQRIEGRKHQRIDVRLSAEIHHQGKAITATTRNLSVGGVCLESRLQLADQSILKLGLFLVFDDVEDALRPPLEVQGRVMWSTEADPESPAMIGIRFEGVTAQQSTTLTRFLKLIEAK